MSSLAFTLSRRTEFGREIKIDVDGNYTNSLYRNNDLVWSEKETWEWDLSKNGDRESVTFRKFRFGVRDQRILPAMKNVVTAPGFWIVQPEKRLMSPVLLCFDLDLDYCFTRNSDNATGRKQ